MITRKDIEHLLQTKDVNEFREYWCTSKRPCKKKSCPRHCKFKARDAK